MVEPDAILVLALQRAQDPQDSLPVADDLAADVAYVCQLMSNRAGARLLAKLHRPEVDIRKPYTEIGGADTFSGRTYDEQYVGPFRLRHDLPLNATTAFLTPALRNIDRTLTREVRLVGSPPELYVRAIGVLNAVQEWRARADDVLAWALRALLEIRDSNQRRLADSLARLRNASGGATLSAEGILRIIEQHLSQPRASRLPVLVVAAAYETAAPFLPERHRALHSHQAADQQTDSLGDVEIVLADDDRVVTCYEIKTRPITLEDVRQALDKLLASGARIDHYLFVTTAPIDEPVQQYAQSLFARTGGVEFVILDCVGFLRHFLHFFHRSRMAFLEHYQALVLNQPESAVSHALKEVLLALRQAAISEGD